MLIHSLAAGGTSTAAISHNLLATAGADSVIHLLQLSNSGGGSIQTAAPPSASASRTAPPRKNIVKRRVSVLPLTVGIVAPVAAGLEDSIGGMLLPLLPIMEGKYQDPAVPGVGYSSSGVPLIVAALAKVLTWKEAW